MESYESWSELQQHEAFRNVNDVYAILKEKYTAVADNTCLGALYGPDLPRVYEITERMLEILKQYRQFGFLKLTDGRVAFSLQHDPMSEQIIDQQLHTKVHRQLGTLNKALPTNVQSQEVAYALSAIIEMPAMSSGQNNNWVIGIPTAEVLQRRQQAEREGQRTTTPSARSTRTSLAETLNMRPYQCSELSIRFNRQQRSGQRPHPYSRANGNAGRPRYPNAIYRADDPIYRPDDAEGWVVQPRNNVWNSQQAERPNNVRAPQQTPRQNRQVLREPRPPRLTSNEIEVCMAGGSNPGLRPMDELIAMLPPEMVQDPQQMTIYMLLRQDQMFITQQKLQREVCLAHQRITNAGFPRERFQTNPGTRPVATEELGDEVNSWPDQNQPRMGRNFIPRVGHLPTGNTTPTESAAGENTEDAEINATQPTSSSAETANQNVETENQPMLE